MQETLELVTENYHFLQKAIEILNDLKRKGEEHEQLEAKLISNIGGTWQRILRIFLAAKKDDVQYAQLLNYIRTHQTDAEKIAEIWQTLSRIIEAAQNEEEGYQNALAHIRNCEETAFQKAYDIRVRLYDQYGPEDEEKRLRRRNLAKTTFVLATRNFFNFDYQEAIRLHIIAIDMFKSLETDGVNVDLDLFVSYSRTANTYYRLAKQNHSASALLDAVCFSNTAYDYLNKLFGFNKNGEIVFYEDYLRAAIDLRNYDPKFRLLFNREDTEIDSVITELRARALNAIYVSDMDAKTKEKKQKELDRISIQGEKSDYYLNDITKYPCTQHDPDLPSPTRKARHLNGWLAFLRLGIHGEFLLYFLSLSCIIMETKGGKSYDFPFDRLCGPDRRLRRLRQGRGKDICAG